MHSKINFIQSLSIIGTLFFLYTNILTIAQEKISPPDPEMYNRVIAYINNSDTATVIEKSLIIELLNSINQDSKNANLSAEEINKGNDIAPLEMLNKTNLWLQKRLEFTDGLIAMFFYNNVEIKTLFERTKNNLDILNNNVEICTNNQYAKNINNQTINFIKDISYNAIIATYPGSEIILNLLIKYIGFQK